VRGLVLGAQATSNDVLALGATGRAGLVKAGIGAVGVEAEDDRFDAVDAEVGGEREDGLGEPPLTMAIFQPSARS